MEDKLCKVQLENIARKIIKKFDKNNENTEYEFFDYMKIALWVKNNIKYNLDYAGRNDLTAIDIYNLKNGVCTHFTRLSNALLYSLGYKVIYVNGYSIEGDDDEGFNTRVGHAWSVIKVNNKWYPFDSTNGIISGKFPISHIFWSYYYSSCKIRGSDNSKILDVIRKFKYIC